MATSKIQNEMAQRCPHILYTVHKLSVTTSCINCKLLSETIFKRVPRVAKSAYYLLHVLPFVYLSVRTYQLVSLCTDLREIWNSGLTETCPEIPKRGYNVVKCRELYTKPQYVLLLPAILDRQKSSIFRWNGIRLLARPNQRGVHGTDCWEIWLYKLKLLVLGSDILTYLLTYLLTSLLHGAESFLRS